MVRLAVSTTGLFGHRHLGKERSARKARVNTAYKPPKWLGIIRAKARAVCFLADLRQPAFKLMSHLQVIDNVVVIGQFEVT
ncbi:MAG: hypothetical protein RL217_425 [Pseudomonadota bacterium]